MATRCVTPRQTCPRPNGFGRNLRSKTRWFAGFCNSHQVSHFATFFIDARAEISVAESRFGYTTNATASPPALRERGNRGPSDLFEFSLALSAPGFGFVGPRDKRAGSDREGREGSISPPVPDARRLHEFAVVCYAGFDNDPSAGSPTETLLRLLLPLNDKVQWTSRDVAGSEPLTSPRSEHFTGPFNR